MTPAQASARKAALKAYAGRVLGYFELKGALLVEADILQPAEALLDLYGEDIRARTYVTHDPLRGEMMLRPDFTLPVLRRHMEGGAMPARYCYAGEVFRMQDGLAAAPSEALQVGYELFAHGAQVEGDAEVFSVIKGALDGQPVRPVMGDMGVLLAAIAALQTSAPRKAALRRHLSRPARFRALLRRFGTDLEMTGPRRALLEAADPLGGITEFPGLRRRDEVLARLDALRADAATPPIPGGQLEILREILDLSAAAPHAISRLRDLAVDLDHPAFQAAITHLIARLDAFAARGIAVDDITFEASYARSAMEYYDGFVFAFLRTDDPAQAVVATGGRYDALTAALGGGAGIPAVGGVIRPELLGDLPC